ncbi:MAG: fumarate hydratase [Nitrososphaerales archaeon]
MISKLVVKSTVKELLRIASVELPNDVKMALRAAYEREVDAVPKMQLKAILDNIDLAEKTGIPMCQDTGIHVVYVKWGDVDVEDLEEAVREGVAEATSSIPLRPNAVHPLTRKNPGTNVGLHMPYIHIDKTKEKFLEITVMPKGFGAENMSALAMLTPAHGLKGVKEFILQTVVKAGGNPCPPGILGIGIGGTADVAMKLAKEALLRPLGSRNPDPEVAKLEEELLEALNGLGIGPMGLGGKTTLLGVNIEVAYTHTAGLPVAVNYQCWAARRASARIYPDGRVEYTSHRKKEV